jgi:Arc/MetJ family transcription regulator
MRKTTLVVDDEVLCEAARILGTKGVKQTIDAALQAVLVQNARANLVERTLQFMDFEFAEKMKEREKAELGCLPPLSGI